MPRHLETHHLQTTLTPPDDEGFAGTLRLHRSGALLVRSRRRGDDPWTHEVDVFPSADSASSCGDELVRHYLAAGYRIVTRLRTSLPAADVHAAVRDPGRLDAAFQFEWARTWEPALTLLRTALEQQRDADAGPETAGRHATHAVLLNRFALHTSDGPWGPSLREVVEPLAHATHRETGTLLVAAGPALLEWLRTYYVPALEPTPATLPAESSDSSTTYAIALGIWQTGEPGPLAHLFQALTTARHMTIPVP